MRKCPVSGEPLTPTKIHDVSVDVSPYGMWLDRSELFLLTEAERREGEHSFWEDLFRKPVEPGVDRARVLSCPVGGKEMKIIEYKGVHIDVSPHGVWLDVGEYEAILNNLRLDPSYVRGIALRLSDMEL